MVLVVVWPTCQAIHAASHVDHDKRVAWFSISIHACGSLSIINARRSTWRPRSRRWSSTVSFHRAVSSELRKVISFTIIRYMIDLKKLLPLLHPIRSGTKTKRGSHAFSRALRQLHVITSSFDWFTVLFVSFVID